MRVALIVVAVLISSAHASAQDADFAVVPSGTAAIRGRVVAAADGRALPRAQVRLTPQGRNLRYLVADEQGQFEFTDLPAGRYELSATLSGYLTMDFGQPNRSNSSIVLRDGQVRSGLELALPIGGAIEVHVTDESGVPVEGAFVQAQRPRPASNGQLVLTSTIADTQRSFATDDRGVLRVYDLPPGEYYVSATTPTVLGERHDPTQQEATGRVQTFHPGVLTVADAEPVVLGLSEVIRIDLVIAKPYTAVRRVTGGAITVHVTDDAGNPRAGAEVRALEVRGEGAQRKFARAASTATSAPRFWEKKDFYTDDRGDARVYGLPPGEYAIVAEPRMGTAMGREVDDRALVYPPIYFPGSASRADAQAISIRPWDEVSLELALTPAPMSRISGRVVRWDGEPGRSFVVLMRNSAGPLYPQGLIDDRMSRAEVVDGEFTFYEVVPGDYIIRTSYDPKSDVRDGDGQVEVTVDGGDVTDVILKTVPAQREHP